MAIVIEVMGRMISRDWFSVTVTKVAVALMGPTSVTEIDFDESLYIDVTVIIICPNSI